MLEEIHSHERLRVLLTDFVGVHVDAHQAELENVLAGRQIRQIIHRSLKSHVLRHTISARAHSLRLWFLRCLDVLAPSDLRLEGVNLLLSAIQLVFVRLHLLEQALVHLVGPRFLLNKRGAQVINLLLLEFKEPMSLAQLLDLIAEGLAKTAKLGAEGPFINPVVDDGHLRVVHLAGFQRSSAHVHEHTDLLVRRLELNLHAGAFNAQTVPLFARGGGFLYTPGTDGLDGPPELNLAELGVGAFALRLRHERPQLPRLRLRLRRSVHRRRKELVVLLLQGRTLAS